jgi:hypothetical protein
MNELDILRDICELSLRYPHLTGVSISGGGLVSVEFHERAPAPSPRAQAPRQRTERDLIAAMRRNKAGAHEREPDPDDE